MIDRQKAKLFQFLKTIQNQLHKFRKLIRDKKIEANVLSSYIDIIHSTCKEIKSNLPNAGAQMVIDCAEALSLAELYEKNSLKDCISALENFVKIYNDINDENLHEFLIINEFMWFTNILIKLANIDLINKFFKEISSSDPEENKMLNYFKFRALAFHHLAKQDFDSAITYLALQQHHIYDADDCLILFKIDSGPYENNQCMKLFIEFKKTIQNRKLVKAQDYIDLILFASKQLKENKDLRLFTYKYALSVLNYIDISEKEKQQLISDILPQWTKSESLKSRVELLTQKLQTKFPEKKLDQVDAQKDQKAEGNAGKNKTQNSDTVPAKQDAVQQMSLDIGAQKDKKAEENGFIPIYIKTGNKTQNLDTVNVKQDAAQQVTPKENGVTAHAPATEVKMVPQIPVIELEQKNTVVQPAAIQAIPNSLAKMVKITEEEFDSGSIKLKQYLKELTEKKEITEHEKAEIRQYVDSLTNDPDYANKSPLAIVSEVDKLLIAKIYNLLNKDTIWQTLIENAFRFLDSKEVDQSDLLLSHKRNLDKCSDSSLRYGLELMSTLPNNDKSEAVKGKIYLSHKGKYIVRDINGIVREGSFDKKLIKGKLADNLNDELFQKQILDITSKARHTYSRVKELNLFTLANEKKISYIYLHLITNMLELLKRVHETRLEAMREAIVPMLTHLRTQDKERACDHLKKFFDYNLAKATEAYDNDVLSTQLGMLIVDNLQFCFSTNEDTTILDGANYVQITLALFNICQCPDLTLEQRDKIKRFLSKLQYVRKGGSAQLKEKIEECFTLLATPLYIRSIMTDALEYLEIKEEKKATSLLSHKKAIDKLLKEYDKKHDSWLTETNEKDIGLIRFRLFCNMLVLLGNINENELPSIRTSIEEILTQLRPKYFDQASKLMREFFEKNLNEIVAFSAQTAVLMLQNFELCFIVNDRITILNENDYFRVVDAILKLCQCSDLKAYDKSLIKAFLEDLETVNVESKDMLYKKIDACLSALDKDKVEAEQKIKQVRENDKPFNEVMSQITKLKELTEINRSSIKKLKYNIWGSTPKSVTSSEKGMRIDYLQLTCLQNILANVRSISLLTKEETQSLKELLLHLKNNSYFEKNVIDILRFMETGEAPVIQEEKQNQTQPEIEHKQELVLRPTKFINEVDKEIAKLAAREKLYRDLGCSITTRPDLVLKEVDEKEFNSLDKIELIRLSKEHKYSAILIKCADKFKLFGLRATNGWGETLLESKLFQHLKFTQHPILFDHQNDQATLAMYYEIISKRAHAFILQRTISEEVWLEQVKEYLGDSSHSLPMSFTNYQSSMDEEFHSATRMRDIIATVETEIKQSQEGKDEESRNKHFCYTLDMAILLSQCPYLFNSYKEKYQVKMGHPFDEALEIFITALSLAKSTKKLVHLTRCLSGIGGCVMNGKYDLALMSTKVSAKKNVIKIESQTLGLKYTVLRLDNQEFKGFIPWDKLPKGFPMNAEEIVFSKERLLPHILEITSKEEHTPRIPTDLSKVHPARKEVVVDRVRALKQSYSEEFKKYEGLIEHFEEPKIENKDSPKAKNNSSQERLNKLFTQELGENKGAADTKEDLTRKQAFQKFMQEAKNSAAELKNPSNSASMIMQFFKQAQQLKIAALVGAGVGFFSNGFYEGGFRGAGSAMKTIGLFALALKTLENGVAYYQHCQKHKKRRK